MPRLRGQSAFWLILAGVAGLAFFWLTDPAGPTGRFFVGDGVDALNETTTGTWVGLAGSMLALASGLWSLTRRTA